ncbi:hypothetical protein V3C99_017559, partial [Haemonchus contortus]
TAILILQPSQHLSNMASRFMKRLIGATVCAFIAFAFICVSFFTQDWMVIVILGIAVKAGVPTGVFPWYCISAGADGWDKCFFFLMLFAWIFQFVALVTGVVALLFRGIRFISTHLFCGTQALITLLIIAELILYGVQYDRNLEAFNYIPGLSVSLGYSYWLLVVAAIFSIVTFANAAGATERARHDDCDCD